MGGVIFFLRFRVLFEVSLRVYVEGRGMRPGGGGSSCRGNVVVIDILVCITGDNVNK